jgi:hypothetical protein
MQRTSFIPFWICFSSDIRVFSEKQASLQEPGFGAGITAGWVI